MTRTPPTLAPAAPARPSIEELAPRALQAWLSSGDCTLVDVREPDEYQREHIEGSRSLPLSQLSPASVGAAVGSRPGDRIVFQCRGGRRSMEAAQRCQQWCDPGVQIFSLAGGIDAWKAAKLPTVENCSVPRLGVLQQTQMAIGLGILTGLAIGTFLHPAGYLLSAFMGAGLVMAGATGACPLARIIGAMPWNRAHRRPDAAGSSRAPS